MKPLKNLPTKENSNGIANVTITKEIFHSASMKTTTKSTQTVSAKRYQSKARRVPEFHEYISLRENTLAENVNTLPYWPYFMEDSLRELEELGLWQDLRDRYIMTCDTRPETRLQDTQCRMLAPYVGKFIDEIGIRWEDIFFWLLASEKELVDFVRSADLPNGSDVSKQLLDRAAHCEKNFDRATSHWQNVFKSLPRPSVRSLRVSAIACSVFLNSTNLSIWQLARRSGLVILQATAPRSPEPKNEKDQYVHQMDFQYRKTACAVCHLQDCPFHGEIREYTDTEDEYDLSEPDDTSSENDDASTTNDDAPPKNGVAPPEKDSPKERDSQAEDVQDDMSPQEVCKNHKKLITVSTQRYSDTEDSTDEDGPANKKWNLSHWLKSKTYLLHKRKPFYPCNHEGSCESANCSCFRAQITCEKTCGCRKSCVRRFPGCSCARDSTPGPCSAEKKCICVRLNRECDPDLCGKCGSAVVLDPVNRYDEGSRIGCCVNSDIQLNLPKKTFLSHSNVHGLGLQVGQRVKKGEYLGEYVGEVCGKREADRRGVIYRHLQTNYLFGLNGGKSLIHSTALQR